MTRQEREELAKGVCNFYEDAANKSVKTAVNYFKKQHIPERTIRYMLKKYLVHSTTEYLPRKGRPVKVVNQQLNRLVKTVNNKTSISQREIAKRYKVRQTTICRTLKKRTSAIIRKRRKAPTMESEDQEKELEKAAVNCTE
ncbi:unnamed protein product [Rotaria sp. Silwood2]|nr:unnamed protein product [Rotaria sp. Silwood2]CAF4368570.1 unnamed protein product [Rotaria sp. Silwood2]